jgi:GGDEF domain-containing protein
MLKKGNLTDHMNNLPGMNDLHQLLGQALEKRGKQLQISWKGRKLAKFTLTLVCNLKGGEPQWTMHCTKEGKGQELLFDYTSCDVLLVCNLVQSHFAESNKDDNNNERATGNTSQSIRHGLYAKGAKSIDSSYQESDSQNKKPYVAGPAPRRKIETINAETAISTGLATQTAPGQYINQNTSTQTREQKTDTALSDSAPQETQNLSSDLGEIAPRGELESISITRLIREITSRKLTGKLEVSSMNDLAIVYIQDGIPVDATAGDAVGDEAMIELLTWGSGQYSFESRVLRNSHTVYQSIESLLAQSRQLSEQVSYLQGAGMLPTSTLIADPANSIRPDFSADGSIDKESLEGFFQALDGRHSIEDMLRTLQISRIKIVYLIYTLATQNLVRICNDNTPREKLVLQPRAIDTAAIQSVMMSLRRAETGMFIFPAFLYFLEQEFFRSYRARAWFSVAVFEMAETYQQDGELKSRPLAGEAILEAVMRISRVKRHVDLLSHYDGQDYALLLPNTKASGSRTFCNRVVRALLEKPLPGVPTEQLSVKIGAASIPEDFKELSSLLGAAELALSHARSTGQNVVLYREIQSITCNA